MTESTPLVVVDDRLEAIAALVADGGEDWGAFERQLMEELMALGRAVMEARIDAQMVSEAFQEEGVRWAPAVESHLSLMTLFGPIRVSRPLFRAERNGPTRCLVSESLGLVGWWTSRAAKYGARLMASVPSRQAEKLWNEATGSAPSRSMLDRLPKKLSEGWELHRHDLEAEVSRLTEVPEEVATVCVSLDGVYAPMRADGKAEHKAKRRSEGIQDKGPKNYREVGCGVIDLLDGDGNRLQTRRFARMPEARKDGLKKQLEQELARLLDARPDVTVVVQADGAQDNWRFLETLPHDYAVTDYFHAVEQLKSGLDHMLGATKPSTDAAHQRLRRILRDEPDGAQQVLECLRRYRRKKHKVAHRTAIPYFERLLPRMNYAEIRDKNLPIGTGVMEGTCKSVVTRRLKQAGMRWDHPGGQAILTLNTLEQSDQFDLAWPLMAEHARLAA